MAIVLSMWAPTKSQSSASSNDVPNAALDGSLNAATFRTDPWFGFDVPTAVPGVDSALLDPRGAWADPAAYDATAAQLVQQFIDNFAQFADGVDAGVRAAGPREVVAA